MTRFIVCMYFITSRSSFALIIKEFRFVCNIFCMFRSMKPIITFYTCSKFVLIFNEVVRMSLNKILKQTISDNISY